MGKALVWFRRDLRINDNPALHQAAADSNQGVVGIFVLTPGQWREHDDAPGKIDFWLRNLAALSESLARLDIPLVIERRETFADCPDCILKVARELKCSNVYLNREYEVNEVRRDQAVETRLAATDIAVHQFHDRVIVPPREIQTRDGRFYSVYTPYRRVWDTRATGDLTCHDPPPRQPDVGVRASAVPDELPGFDSAAADAAAWPAGEPEAQRRLDEFSERIADYHTGRDIPGVNGTSRLSPYLTAGVISPQHCLATVLAAANHRIAEKSGPAVWISELTWRDFYTHVLVGFPRVSMHQPFRRKTRQIPWRESEQDLVAWKTGQTGYPLVDAGMRQLRQTGWMHNRLRMVTAMFLTKHLLIDWRLGERHFMQHLIDGDLAANNGGWQWSASTGTDAVPYFRIFNPFSQSKRFDPEGRFIKTWCPELADVEPSCLHHPKKLADAARRANYPPFLVDHKEGRQRALAAFKALG